MSATLSAAIGHLLIAEIWKIQNQLSKKLANDLSTASAHFATAPRANWTSPGRSRKRGSYRSRIWGVPARLGEPFS
jgi:hypothetical protein